MAPLSPIFVILLFLFGAAVMSLEIVAAKVLAPFFGGSIHIWGSIISSVMVQFAIGYLLGGYLSKRHSSLRLLAILLLLASLWLMFLPWFGKAGLVLVADLITNARIGSMLGMNLLFFVPVTLMAMVSPYVIGLIGADPHKAGSVSASVLCVSTLGAVVGTNATTFYLLEWYSVPAIIFGLGLTCAVCCCGVLCWCKWAYRMDLANG